MDAPGLRSLYQDVLAIMHPPLADCHAVQAGHVSLILHATHNWVIALGVDQLRWQSLLQQHACW